MGLYADLLLRDLNPALYWRFSELTGSTAVDSSGNGRDGTYGSGVILSGVPGALGLDADTAVALSGTGTSFVRSTYNPFATGVSRSFEGWAYNSAPATDSTNRSLWGSDGTGNRPYMRVIANSGNVTFRPDSSVGSDSVWTSVWPGLNQWVYWVLIFNDGSDTAELFINGVSQGTRAQTGVFNAAPGNFQAGSLSSPSAAEPFIGRLDEVAVYLTNVSLNAIEAHFQVGSQRLNRVRDKPPLRFSVLVTNPSGSSYRWAYDEPKPANVPTGLNHSDTMPGGFEQMGGTLPRKPDIEYADLERFSTIQLKSVGGYIFGEYRLDSAPRVSGDQFSVAPNAVGWQAALEDQRDARMIYVDISNANWLEPPDERKAAMGTAGLTTGRINVSSDQNGGLVIEWTNAAMTTADWNELDYAAPAGVKVAFFGYKIDRTAGFSASCDGADLFASDTVAYSSFETYALTTGSVFAQATLSPPRRYVLLRGTVTGAVTPGAGTQERYPNVAVFGDHGLTLRAASGTNGVLASDVVTHAVRRWAPLLTITPDSVQASSFVIEHLSFPEATTAGEIVRQASRFDLPDWAVWGNRIFYWTQQGARARYWRTRVGVSGLEETGAQVERTWNSIVVQYQDVDGSAKTVGPPGSGADTEDSSLVDSDPANPANQLGIVRRDLLQMGTGTPALAIQIGRFFLAQSKLLDRSGRAKAVGYIEDTAGVVHPYWMPRAGDYISFLDAADTSYRRIVRTQKDHDARTVTFDLDAPPEGLQALLERLGVELQPLGVGT